MLSTWSPYLVIGSILCLLLSLYYWKVSSGSAFFALAYIYWMVGWIDTKSFLGAFIDESLLLVVLLFILSNVLEKTSIKEYISNRIFSGNFRKSFFRLNFLTILYSMFINNIAVVSIVSSLIKISPYPPAQLLLPMSFAAILGGTLTLIGTSTNLVLNGLIQNAGYKQFQLFDFFPIGIGAVVLGGLYLSFFSKVETKDKTEEDNQKLFHYFIEAVIEKNSPLIGKSIEQNKLRNLKALFLTEIYRENKLIAPAKPDEVLKANDILIFAGDIHHPEELFSISGLRLFDEPITSLEKNLAEVVISHESSLVGQTIKEAQFRSEFDSSVVAVRRGNEILKGKIGNLVIQAGDYLILAYGIDFWKKQDIYKNFYYVSSLNSTPTKSVFHNYLILVSFLGLIFGNLFQIFSLLKGAVFVVLLLTIMRILKLKEISSMIPFNLIFTIASALVLSQAIIRTRTSDLIVEWVNPLLFYFSWEIALMILFLFVILLTELVSNSAAAAISFPFAISIAKFYNMDPIPFFFVIGFGASASFLTPYGYHTNMLVYSLGGYEPSDYWKLGWPLTLIYFIGVSSAIIFRYN